MTPAEYIQLKAFSRVDGAWLSLLWIASFACYIMGLTSQLYGMVAMMLALITPFFVARRLRLFRDEALDGQISFLRGYAYSVLTFFYAGILFAVAQYCYFAFIDSGYLAMCIGKMIDSPEGQLLAEQYDMKEVLAESLQALKDMRPIDFALNVLTVNISIGLVLGVPVALLMQKKR